MGAWSTEIDSDYFAAAGASSETHLHTTIPYTTTIQVTVQMQRNSMEDFKLHVAHAILERRHRYAATQTDRVRISDPDPINRANTRALNLYTFECGSGTRAR